MSRKPATPDAAGHEETPLDRRGMLRVSALSGAAAMLGARFPLSRDPCASFDRAVQATFYVNVKDFGARGDGATDDTRAIQNAMNALTDQGLSETGQGGGTLFFPAGSYIVSGPLRVGGSNLWLQGVGKRNTQLPAWVALARDAATARAVPSTLYLTTRTAGFVLPNTSFCNGFRVSGLTLVGPGHGNIGGTPAQSAFLFDLSGRGQFNRDFVFEDMSVTGCGVAFNLFAASADTGGSLGSAGVIRIVRCSVQHNYWIALTGPALHWNGFVYQQNDSGQNGFDPGSGGIDVAGANVSICDNVLEGTRNAVRISGGYQSAVVANNYFEANPGDYCICIDGSQGPWVVGPNSFNRITATHAVLAVNTARGVSHDPAWLRSCINVQTPEPGSSVSADDRQLVLNNAAADRYLRVDTQLSVFTRPPAGTAVAGPVHVQEGNSQAASPVDGAPMPVMAGSTAAGRAVTFPGAPLQLPAGDAALWLVASFAMRRRSSAPADPAFTLTLTGADVLAPPTASGTPLTTPVPQYERFVQVGDWALVTLAVRIRGARQAVTAALQVLPYGGGAAGGLQYEVRPPILYVVRDINGARPYFDPYQARQEAAPVRR
jgi:hypothetical protein